MRRDHSRYTLPQGWRKEEYAHNAYALPSGWKMNEFYTLGSKDTAGWKKQNEPPTGSVSSSCAALRDFVKASSGLAFID
ncbi:hypothetical protein N9U05_00590, partial [bacterium]|nr:hypothetical protein [bacterium]